MESETISQLAQMIIQGMISVVFIWAWAQERKERQELLTAFSKERESWMKELIDLAREAYGLKSRTSAAQAFPVPPPPPHTNTHGTSVGAFDGDKRQ